MIGDRWGVTEAEVARRYPCDDLVADPELRAWRGVTVHAPPERLWPWVAQVRLAPYSYDRIDNLGRRSPQQLRDLSDPVPGERFTTSGTRRLGWIVSAAPPEQLTGRIAGVFMSYLLVPEGDTTRLLLKLVGPGRWTAPLLCVGDLVMARRQLLNFKRLAEQAAARPDTGAGGAQASRNSPATAAASTTTTRNGARRQTASAATANPASRGPSKRS